MKFTDKSVSALRPKASRYEVWAGDGFGVRVTPHGAKSWVWMYRFQGKARRMTLGAYPAMGLADANLALSKARKLLEQGEDPGTARVQSNKAERTAETVKEMAEDYLEKWAKPRKRSAGEDERILNKDVLPVWGRKKAKDITRKDVIALLDGIVERGSPIAANRTLALVRKMFAWAVSRDIVPASPCTAVKAPSKESRRDRVLTAEEIAAFWAALDDPRAGITAPIRFALKLQLVTGQRKGEVVGSEWSEFDIDGEKVWTIPAAKAKNGMAHRVPLSPLALALLREIKETEIDRLTKRAKRQRHAKPVGMEAASVTLSRWVFASPRTGLPITGEAVDHAMRDARAVLGVGTASPHDLRRTAASHMTSMGVSRLVVSKILNHAEPGITAVYDRHSYDQEKRQALEAWDSRLTEIIGGKAPASECGEEASAS